jgi:hypothetical protein
MKFPQTDRATPESSTARQHGLLSFFLIALAALLPVCVLHLGYTGSDFEFHLGSWREVLEAWRSGVALPSWASHANFGQGEPRFLFYPPLSFFLGAGLYAMVGNALAPQAFIFVSLLLAGLAMRSFASDFLDRKDATFAAILYSTSYYLVVSALLRFAAAEVFSAAFLPLLLKYLLRSLTRPNPADCARLGLCFAGIWLTDIPAAIGVTWAFFLCSLLDLALRRQVKAFLSYGLAQAMGFVLIAFYLIPALLEKKNISSRVLLKTDYRESFLFTGKSSWFLLKYPLWAWVILGVALVWWGLRSRAIRNDSRRQRSFSLMAWLTALVFFLETPFSLPLWAHLPQLAFVQFPYRLDLVLGCIFPLIALAALRRPSYRIALCVFWLGWLLLPIGTRLRQAKAHHETVTAAQVQQHVEQGYPGIHEYAPASSEGGGRPQILPRIAPAGANPACAPTLETWQPEKLAFRSSANIPCSYQLDVLFYPDWRVALDGQSAPILHQAPNGLILVDTPPGDHQVELRFRRFTPAAVLSALVTLLGILAAAWMLLRKPTRKLATNP